MARRLVVNPTTGKLDVIDEAGVSSGGSYNVETYILNPTDISNKSKTLVGTPTTPSLTRVVVINGIEQEYNVDFTVSGNTVSWNGLGLESLLTNGDKIIIIYE